MSSIQSSSSSSQYDPMDVVVSDASPSLDTLPNELSIEILSYLNLSDLGKMSLMNKKWKELARDPVLEREAIYRTMAFGSEKWQEYFGAVVDKSTAKTLPKDIGNILRRISLGLPKEMAQKSLFLFWKPKTINDVALTINSTGMLVQPKFPSTTDGYSYICDDIITELGNTPNKESLWELMTTDVLPGSGSLSYAKQQDLVAAFAARTKTACEVPDALSAITCIYAKYVSSGTRLFNDGYCTSLFIHDYCNKTYCKENVEGNQVIVGLFGPNGLQVRSDNSLYYGRGEVRVAALWKFYGD